LELACRAAKAAGAVLRESFQQGSEVKLETSKDIKLAADVQAECVCLEILRSGSDYPILSEEAGEDAAFESAGLRWIVDPLDGTFNFSRRLPLCCVSVGLWNGSQPVLGVIYDFSADVLYRGIVGVGAWRNEEPMSVSLVIAPGKAAIATGFPAGGDFGRDSIEGFVRQVQHYKKVRMIGSAALALAFVAAGHVDAYQEDDINLWDIAAGLALVSAAGGRFAMRPGTGRWQFEVFATNAGLPLPETFAATAS
jgi:myo-inositol-1(or 4)-monophosphatase